MGFLAGKMAVITGSSRGLGLAIARTYAGEGASVVLAGRDARTLDAAVRSLRDAGASATGIVCDVADLAQVEALRDHAISTFGRLDIWVNNAGLAGVYGPTADIPIASFERGLRTNIFGVYYGSVVAIRHFERAGYGKLINLLGRGDKKPVKYQNAYASTKTWVRSFTLALAQEYAPATVGVYAVNPGLMDTDLLRKVDAIAGYEAKLAPLRTVIRLWGNPPETAARKLLWLASPATDGKTGLEVHVLTPLGMVAGLARDLGRRIMRKPEPDITLRIHTVAPERDREPSTRIVSP